MTRKQKRTTIILGGVTVAIAATLLVLTAMKDSIVYFHSPTDVMERGQVVGKTIRVGGIVAPESYIKGEGETIAFDVTDMEATISVKFTGIVPALFREGQGVIAEGAFDDQGIFQAKTILAKHDENYMPKEVADALKEAGHWQDYEAQQEDKSSTPSPLGN